VEPVLAPDAVQAAEARTGAPAVEPTLEKIALRNTEHAAPPTAEHAAAPTIDHAAAPTVEPAATPIVEHAASQAISAGASAAGDGAAPIYEDSIAAGMDGAPLALRYTGELRWPKREDLSQVEMHGVPLAH
jgi:hypothetical protein